MRALKKGATFVLLLSFLLQPVLTFAQVISEVPEAPEEPVSSSSSISQEADASPALPITAPVINEPDIKQNVLVAEPEQSASILSPQSLSLAGIENESPDLTRKTIQPRFYGEPDPVTGSLNYTYPIAVPPGRNKLQPTVNLVYTTQQSPEVNTVGYGWDVSIPYIQRINKKGTDSLYSQNYFYSSLDGELYQTSTSSDMYGAKVENGAFTTYQYATSTSWIVTDKNGTRYMFGMSSSTRQDNPSDSTQVYKWMLQEVRDTNDNFITYEYTKNTGQIYPSRIVYTGSGTTPGIFEVNFLLGARTDVATSSVAGFPIVSAKLITEISTKVLGTTSQVYMLGYGTGDNGYRSTLNSIIQSGVSALGTTTTLPATQFTYKVTEKNWEQVSTPQPPIIFDAATYLADLNGDGLVDVLESDPNVSNNTAYLKTATGWTHSTTWTPPIYLYGKGARLTDVNGDGLTDIVQAFTSSGSTTIATYINNGAGWTASITWNSPILIAGATDPDPGVRILDLNGDGLADIVKSNTGTSNAYINNGAGWTASSTWNAPIDFVTNNADANTRLEDINNDNLPDILQSFSSTTATDALPALTISAWLRPSAVNGERSIVSYGRYNSGYDWSYLLDTNDTGTVYFSVYKSAGSGYSERLEFNTSQTLTPGTWYYVTATWNGTGTAKIYINGVLQATNTNTNITSMYNSTYDVLHIGTYRNSPYGDKYYAGDLDELHISSASTTDARVAALYQNQNTPTSFYTVGPETAFGTASTSETYTYDPIGNITNKSNLGTYLYQGNQGASYANAHAVTSIGSTTYAYDTNGNLTTVGSTTHTFNYQNQLLTSSTASTTSSYTYDAQGSRVQLTVGSTTSTYPNQYYTLTGTTTEKDLYANGSLIASISNKTGTTTTYWIHPDHLGGTNIVTTQSGSPIENTTYFPYGALRSDTTNTTYDQSKKYIGQEYDGATQLNYLNARYQDPARGQFLSQDPTFLGNPMAQNLTNPQTLNSYSYANDNPIVYKDPNGDFAFLIPVAFGGVGALANVGALGITDLVTGNRSSWQDYSGAAVGGAAGGLSLLTGAGAFGSGAITSGTQELTTEVLNGIGSDDYLGSFNPRRIVTNSIAGGVLGKVGGAIKVPGVSSGRNSLSAVTQQIVTKYSNGTIQNVSGKTATKALGSIGVGSIPQSVTDAVIQYTSKYIYYSYTTATGSGSGKIKVKTPTISSSPKKK